MKRKALRYPFLLGGGQGQVIHNRELVGLPGMACALGSLGVQGSLAVTLNKNRRLPFERLEARWRGGRINTKVGAGVLQALEAQAAPSHLLVTAKGGVLVIFSGPCSL